MPSGWRNLDILRRMSEQRQQVYVGRKRHHFRRAFANPASPERIAYEESLARTGRARTDLLRRILEEQTNLTERSLIAHIDATHELYGIEFAQMIARMYRMFKERILELYAERGLRSEFIRPMH